MSTMKIEFNLNDECRRLRLRPAGKVDWYPSEPFLNDITTSSTSPAFRYSAIALKNLLVGPRSLTTVMRYFLLFSLMKETSSANGWKAEEELNDAMQRIAQKYFKQKI